MLHLILAHRHEIGAIQQDVGRLQHRIVEDPGHDLFLPRRLLLERGLPLEFAKRRERIENPGEFGVLGHLRLHEYGRDSGIQSRREQSHGHLPGTSFELVARVRHRDGVIVHHAEKRLVGVLQGHPVLHGAEVVSYVEITRRLNAAEDA